MRILKPLPGALLMPQADIAGDWPINSLGGRIFDRSGNDHTGTLVGNTHWALGRFGPALRFDGVGDEIIINNSPELFSMPALTIIAWVKYGGIERANEYNIVDAWTAGDTNYLLRFDDSVAINKIEFYIDTIVGIAGGAFDNTDLSDQLLHQIVAVYDGVTMRVYKDAVISPTSIAHTGAIDAGASNISIGGQIAAATDFWNGKIEQLAICNKGLVGSEVARFYREAFYRYPENRCFAVA